MPPLRFSLFGYRRSDVDAFVASQDHELRSLHVEVARGREALAKSESESEELAGMVIEREREIHELGARLREARETHDRNIAVLGDVTARLEEMQAQARGQATKIRMKALREAVKVSRRVQALSAATEASGGSATPVTGDPAADAPAHSAAAEAPPLTAPEANGGAPIDFDGLFEGKVRLEIGPLGDFSQLVGFEDAIGSLGASEISVERFSEGRATLSMHLDEPLDLLHELESRSALDFKVRHTAPDNLILDLDEDGEAEAA